MRLLILACEELIPHGEGAWDVAVEAFIHDLRMSDPDTVMCDIQVLQMWSREHLFGMDQQLDHAFLEGLVRAGVFSDVERVDIVLAAHVNCELVHAADTVRETERIRYILLSGQIHAHEYELIHANLQGKVDVRTHLCVLTLDGTEPRLQPLDDFLAERAQLGNVPRDELLN